MKAHTSTQSPTAWARIKLAVSSGASLVGWITSGAGAIMRTVQDKLRERLTFADFGIVDDGGATDQTVQLLAAFAEAKARGVTLYSGPGVFKYSTKLVVEGFNLICEGPDRTQFEFYGAGTAMEYTSPSILASDETRGFMLLSKAAGQNGLHVKGSCNGHKIGAVVIRDFDGFGCQYGVSGAQGVFFSDTDYIWCHAATVEGDTGFIVDGGAAPNSNANVFKNVYVGGRWRTLFDVRSNGNVFIGGGAEFYPNLVTIDEVYKVSGVANKFIGPYIESGGGAVFPNVIIRFTATAVGNTFEKALLQMQLPAGGIEKYVVDGGLGNQFSSSLVGLNYPYSTSNVSGVNLLQNTSFRGLNGAPSISNTPFGWMTFGASPMVRDTSITRGTSASLKLSGTNQAVNQYLYSSTAGRAKFNIFPKAYFLGKNMRAGCWVYSVTPGCGEIRAASAGTFGTSTSARHSGNGWEFLSTAIRVDPVDTTEVYFQCRIPAGIAGDAYFSEPVFVVGNELPQFVPAPLLGDGAYVSGRFCQAPPITFTDLDTTPSVLDGNLFVTANTGATTITNFDDGFIGQEIKVRAGEGNTTIANNANIHTTTGANKLLALDGVYKFVFHGTKWYEF